MERFLERFGSYFVNWSLHSLNVEWEDIVEVIIISFLLYHIMAWAKHTKVWLLMKGIIIILVFILLAILFEMNTIMWIVKNVLGLAVTAIIVILQPNCGTHSRSWGGKILFPTLSHSKSRRMNAFLTRQ